MARSRSRSKGLSSPLMSMSNKHQFQIEAQRSGDESGAGHVSEETGRGTKIVTGIVSCA